MNFQQAAKDLMDTWSSVPLRRDRMQLLALELQIAYAEGDRNQLKIEMDKIKNREES
jgi:hypothetical protein